MKLEVWSTWAQVPVGCRFSEGLHTLGWVCNMHGRHDIRPRTLAWVHKRILRLSLSWNGGRKKKRKKEDEYKEKEKEKVGQMYMCIYIDIHVCICVQTHTHTYLCMHIHIFIYAYLSLCFLVTCLSISILLFCREYANACSCVWGRLCVCLNGSCRIFPWLINSKSSINSPQRPCAFSSLLPPSLLRIPQTPQVS